MGVNNKGHAICKHCGAEYSIFTIFNRDMQGLAKVWRRRHERGCEKRTPAERRKWAKRNASTDDGERAIWVDLDHPGFQDVSAEDACLQS